MESLLNLLSHPDYSQNQSSGGFDCNRLISAINKTCARLALKWRRLILGTSTEEEEIWRGLHFSATCQFALS